jgi:hypothetical protein
MDGNLGSTHRLRLRDRPVEMGCEVSELAPQKTDLSRSKPVGRDKQD